MVWPTSSIANTNVAFSSPPLVNTSSTSAASSLVSKTTSLDTNKISSISYDPTTAKIQSASSPGTGTGCNDSGTSTYRYPIDGSDDQDWLKITIRKYKRKGSAGSISGQAGTLLGGVGQGEAIASIYFAVPNDINTTNNANWGDSDLNSLAAIALGGAKEAIQGSGFTDAIEAALKSIGFSREAIGNLKNARELSSSFFSAQFLSALTGSNIDINSLLARAGGKVINPNKELLFQGPTLREFTFAFPIIPSSASEAAEVKNIIRLLKIHSAPKRESQGDFFLSSPDIFELGYLHKGSTHPFLNKFKYCALKSVNVNYTGSSVYSTYDDGTPTHMILGLTFGEVEPIFAEDFKGDTSVGY
jgi:hypothetical protein